MHQARRRRNERRVSGYLLRSSYMPGTKIEMSDRIYIVHEDGSWHVLVYVKKEVANG